MFQFYLGSVLDRFSLYITIRFILGWGTYIAKIDFYTNRHMYTYSFFILTSNLTVCYGKLDIKSFKQLLNMMYYDYC